MASLENRTDISEKVLIFDDPITSLDYDRQSKVARKIAHISTQVNQVFALTHDRHFFRHLFVQSKKMNLAPYYYYIKKMGNSSEITVSDEVGIKYLVDKKHHYEFWELQQYSLGLYNLNEPSNSLRQLFEDLLEYKFPETYKEIKDKNIKTHFTSQSLKIYVENRCIDENLLNNLKGANGELDILSFTNDESHASANNYSEKEKKDYVKKGLELFRKV